MKIGVILRGNIGNLSFIDHDFAKNISHGMYYNSRYLNDWNHNTSELEIFRNHDVSIHIETYREYVPHAAVHNEIDSEPSFNWLAVNVEYVYDVIFPSYDYTVNIHNYGDILHHHDHYRLDVLYHELKNIVKIVEFFKSYNGFLSAFAQVYMTKLAIDSFLELHGEDFDLVLLSRADFYPIWRGIGFDGLPKDKISVLNANPSSDIYSVMNMHNLKRYSMIYDFFIEMYLSFKKMHDNGEYPPWFNLNYHAIQKEFIKNEMPDVSLFDAGNFIETFTGDNHIYNMIRLIYGWVRYPEF